MRRIAEGDACERQHYGDLRKNEVLAQKMAFQDKNPKISDEKLWVKPITYTPFWSPHSLLPPELARRFGIS